MEKNKLKTLKTVIPTIGLIYLIVFVVLLLILLALSPIIIALMTGNLYLLWFLFLSIPLTSSIITFESMFTRPKTKNL